jgi:hypothetical protein
MRFFAVVVRFIQNFYVRKGYFTDLGYYMDFTSENVWKDFHEVVAQNGYLHLRHLCRPQRILHFLSTATVFPLNTNGLAAVQV